MTELRDLRPKPLPTWLAKPRDLVFENAVAITILISAAIARVLLSRWNSYWIDELYAVWVQGILQETLWDAIQRVAAGVHPPFYQLALDTWMNVFGDGEGATRALSNLFVTGGGWFVYLLARDAFSKKVGIWTVATYSLLYSTLYYGIETRPYGLTIFLAALSSYLFLRIVRRGLAGTWRRAVLSPAAAGLVLVNLLLLLTHYYNAFFWGAQVVFAALVAMVEFRPRRWLASLGTAVGAWVVQFGLFWWVWGWATTGVVDRNNDRIAVDDPARILSPFELLRRMILNQNFRGAPRWFFMVAGVILAIMAVRSLIQVARRNPDRFGAWARLYMVGWLILPMIAVWAVFDFLDVAKYTARYFVYSTIPLAALVFLGLEEVGDWVTRIVRRVSDTRTVELVAPALALVVISTMVVPGTIAAATQRKADFRGTAQELVASIEADPRGSYIIFDTSYREYSVLDYYLARYSASIRVGGVIQRLEERRGHSYRFETDARIESHDYLIVTFIYFDVSEFPIALKILEDRYEVRHRHLNPGGHGYVVFDIHPDD